MTRQLLTFRNKKWLPTSENISLPDLTLYTYRGRLCLMWHIFQINVVDFFHLSMFFLCMSHGMHALLKSFSTLYFVKWVSSEFQVNEFRESEWMKFSEKEVELGRISTCSHLPLCISYISYIFDAKLFYMHFHITLFWGTPLLLTFNLVATQGARKQRILFKSHDCTWTAF